LKPSQGRGPQELSTTQQDKRVRTGIDGLDRLLEGGLPSRSLTILGGRPGTGKTALASRFLYEGASKGEACIYVSFAEGKSQFLSNMQKFGLDFQKLADTGAFEFIDLTTVSGEEAISDALSLVVSRVSSMQAKRLVVDSFTAIAQGFEKLIDARIALHVILGKLVREEGCTTILLVEMPYGTNRIGLGIEEFVGDGIIVLDSVPHKGGTLRTINIKKMRGTNIDLNPSTYEISPEKGVVVFPTIGFEAGRGVGERRIRTHIRGFDELVEGGFIERSVSVLVGAAGTGKTTFSMEYVYNGAKDEKENGLLISFGESSDQLQTIATKIGMDRITQFSKEGLITVEGIVPERGSIEAHLLNVERLLSESGAKRVVFDDVTGLQAICTDDEFYSMLKKLAQLAKSRGATVLMTLTSAELSGTSITGLGLSTIMDGIVLLRYVELDGKMDRSMILLKMRGTRHDNSIKKFSIGEGGILVEGSFAGYAGVLTGEARRITEEFNENERRILESEQKDRVKRREEFEKQSRGKR
jgi:circadian clock protein KaiC